MIFQGDKTFIMSNTIVASSALILFNGSLKT